MTVAGGFTIESGDILNCSSILLISDFLFVMVWIWFLVWLIPLILSLSNLICISFNIISVGVANWIFDFAAFIGIIKGWSKHLEDDDDEDDDDDMNEIKSYLNGNKISFINDILIYYNLEVFWFTNTSYF